MAVATRAFEGTYAADRAHSSVLFTVTHMKVSRFRASFADVEATLAGGEDGVRLEGRAAVESLSIDTPPELREHVVFGADFFDGAGHPEVAFASSDVELREDGTAAVAGELTIKGITRPITAQGAFAPAVEDPFGGMRASLELRATIDRRDWEMDWQLALPDGSDALGWDVELDVRLELTQVA